MARVFTIVAAVMCVGFALDSKFRFHNNHDAMIWIAALVVVLGCGNWLREG